MSSAIDLMEFVRAQGAAYYLKTLTPPWGVAVEQHEDLWRFHLVLAGSTWIKVSGATDSIHLKSGDFVIVPRGVQHVLSNEPSCIATVCEGLPGSAPASVANFEPVCEDDKRVQLLCGYFRFAQGSPLWLLDKVPEHLVARDTDPGILRPLVNLIRHELKSRPVGTLVVLNRLSEIMFYIAIRQWWEGVENASEAPVFLGDRRLQRALVAIHESPEKPWTVEDLAKIAGRSRTAFSNDFRQTTGYTPINYLAYWRTEVARQMLAESDFSITEIAHRTGYADVNAFSRAFGRAMGLAPGNYRKASRHKPTS